MQIGTASSRAAAHVRGPRLSARSEPLVEPLADDRSTFLDRILWLRRVVVSRFLAAGRFGLFAGSARDLNTFLGDLACFVGLSYLSKSACQVRVCTDTRWI